MQRNDGRPGDLVRGSVVLATLRCLLTCQRLCKLCRWLGDAPSPAVMHAVSLGSRVDANRNRYLDETSVSVLETAAPCKEFVDRGA